MTATDPSPPLPRLEPSQDRALAALIVACAAMSGVALVLHAADVVEMPFTISFLALPALLVIVGLMAWFGRVRKVVLLRRVWVGVAAGAVATLAYDVVRYVIFVATPTTFDPFRAHRPFGGLMLDTDPNTTAAFWAGWSYHVWNGLSFAVMYVMLFGRGRWTWALAWALALETATIITYPNLFDIDITRVGFISVSLIGHAVYGVTLGVLTREWLRPELTDPWRLPRPDLRRGFE